MMGLVPWEEEEGWTLYVYISTKERPDEDSMRSQPSTSQKKCSHQTPDQLTPWCWTSQPPDWEISLCYLSQPADGILLRQPELTKKITEHLSRKGRWLMFGQNLSFCPFISSFINIEYLFLWQTWKYSDVWNRNGPWFYKKLSFIGIDKYQRGSFFFNLNFPLWRVLCRNMVSFASIYQWAWILSGRSAEVLLRKCHLSWALKDRWNLAWCKGRNWVRLEGGILWWRTGCGPEWVEAKWG